MPQTNPRYGARIENAARKLDDPGHKRMSVEYAARKIHRLIYRRNLPPMRIIGGKYKFMYFIARFLPLRLILRLINGLLGR
jgi:hypothetical protein